MIEQLHDLPAGVDGLRARGVVTKNDYCHVVQPLLAEAQRTGRRLRLIYQIGPDFERFTSGAAWEDLRVGWEYLSLFERCALVTSVAWIRDAARLFAPTLPCPLRTFEHAEWESALAWLTEAPAKVVPHRLTPEGILLIEPDRHLRREDFEGLASTVDPWIAAHGPLRGVVVHARAFPPGWENPGSLLRHLQFLREHRHHARRVALATDSRLADVAGGLGKLVGTTVKHFGFQQVDQAVAWVQAA
jgi:hypothetical protein